MIRYLLNLIFIKNTRIFKKLYKNIVFFFEKKRVKLVGTQSMTVKINILILFNLIKSKNDSF